MAKPIDPIVIQAALRSQASTGIPASISVAQYGLESGWGKSIPKGSNNPFGMKVRKGMNDPFVERRTREVINGKDVYITDKFRKFASLEEAFVEHAKLLAEAKVYARCRALLKGPNPADDFADCLCCSTPQRPSYATDPNYGKSLRAIMKGRDLYKLNDYPRIRSIK